MSGSVACKVLMLLPSMAGGGAERVAVNLLRHFDRARIEPVLGLLRAEGPFLEQVPGDVRVVNLNRRRARFAADAIVRLVWRERPGAVLSILSHLNQVTAMCRPFFPAATRCVIREGVVPSRAGGRVPLRLRKFLLPRLYRRLHTVICQSSDVRDDLVRTFGAAPTNLCVLGNPLDVDALDRARREPCELDASAPGHIHFVAAGRLHLQKGFDRLLEAFARVPGTDRRLTILGEGPARGALAARAGRLGLGERCRFAGYQNNPFAWFARADAFVLSSRYEGFPNAALEALACGTPVIAVDAPGGIRELVQPGCTGVLVPDGDLDALAGALAAFDPAAFAADEVGASVRERFDARWIAAAYADVLDPDRSSGTGVRHA